jgi:hypothetical protein
MQRRSLKTLFLAAAFVILALPGSARAWSVLGAETLKPSENAVEFGAGFPQIRGGFHIPVMQGMELTPFFTFFYGLDTHVPVVGDALGVQMKFRLLESGGFTLSVAAEPAFLIAYHPGTAIGIQIGLPQLLMSYRVNNMITFHGGLKIPFGFQVHKFFAARIPILFNMGAEFTLAPRANLFFVMDAGPEIWAAKGGSATEFAPNILIGTALKF